MQWHVAEWAVDDDEPVAIRLWVEAAENATPWELPLAAQVRSNDALVKSSPLGIFRRGGIIKMMGVAQEHGFDSLFQSGGHLNGELAEARRMLSEAMLIPTSNGQGTRGDRLGRRHYQWLDQRMSRNPKPIRKANFSCARNDHRFILLLPFGRSRRRCCSKVRRVRKGFRYFAVVCFPTFINTKVVIRAMVATITAASSIRRFSSFLLMMTAMMEIINAASARPNRFQSPKTNEVQAAMIATRATECFWTDFIRCRLN